MNNELTTSGMEFYLSVWRIMFNFDECTGRVLRHYLRLQCYIKQLNSLLLRLNSVRKFEKEVSVLLEE